MKHIKHKRMHTHRTFTIFHNEHFNPRNYLNHYYSKVDSENDELLKFFIESYQNVNPNSLLLEFGGGPTIYSLITASAKVKEIHFSERLKYNLEEVKLWKEGNVGAFNWDIFIRRALQLEGDARVYQKDIDARAGLMRSKITTFLYCNAFSSHPLRRKYHPFYDVLNVNFVPESITSSKEKWEQALANITSLLKPGGLFVTTALRNAKYYELAERRFPAVDINEEDLKKVLITLGFQRDSIVFRTIKAYPYRGYDGMIFLRAKKR